jgi:restriction system protein
MTKRYSFGRQFSRALVKGAAQSRRSAAARQRATAAEAKLMDREAKRRERDRLIGQAEDARAERQAYLEGRQEEADELNTDLEETIQAITELLSEAVSRGEWALEFEALKTTPEIPAFNANGHDKPIPEPRPEDYRPARNPLAGILPGMRRKQEEAEGVARLRLQAEVERHAGAEKQRLARLDALRQEHNAVVEHARQEANEHNQEVDAFRNQYWAGDPEAVVRYFTAVLESDDPLEGLPTNLKLAFVPDSRQLVIERDLPTMDFVPTIGSHRYVKAHDRIETTDRPVRHRQVLYASLISQLALRTLHIVIAADAAKSVDTIVFNGFVSTRDPATGKHIRLCLITLRTSREALAEIDFAMVDPVACLGRLNAHVSRSPAELLPVRPIVDFNMVDKRFVESTDVLSALEERPNLMELTPGQFENLITNLFEKLGLQTKLTQASRDGGVDCVAWDLHPITGGKVIIQAKRYKHTVGVSAVRDLFGTVHNEGAGKGILVTTSHYGKAAYDFAENKPLELLTGSNLLSLLEEHAGIRARIDMPEDWHDPVPDTEEPVSKPDGVAEAAAVTTEPPA